MNSSLFNQTDLDSLHPCHTSSSAEHKCPSLGKGILWTPHHQRSTEHPIGYYWDPYLTKDLLLSYLISNKAEYFWTQGFETVFPKCFCKIYHHIYLTTKQLCELYVVGLLIFHILLYVGTYRVIFKHMVVIVL